MEYQRLFSPELMAKALSARSGKHIPIEWIRADIARGAPANSDETMSLVEYTAWLVREVLRVRKQQT